MIKSSKREKPTVELRPSRIRRDPPASAASAAEAEKKLHWQSNEREIWLAIAGVVAFALAIDIVLVAISAWTN